MPRPITSHYKPRSASRALFFVILCSFSTPAEVGAFDPRTHMWVGQEVLKDVLTDCKVTVDGREYAIDEQLCQALRDYPSAYRMGHIGPDAVPDLIAGQGAIHPGVEGGRQNDDWFTAVLKAAQEQDGAESLAFAHGFVGHSAGDVFAHTYVNEYTGDVFNLMDGEIEVERRHFVLEKYIGKHTPPLTDAAGNALGELLLESGFAPVLELPEEFVVEQFILNPEAAEEYRKLGPQGKHLVIMYDVYSFAKSLQRILNPLQAEMDGAVSWVLDRVASLTQELDKIPSTLLDVDRRIKEARDKILKAAGNVLIKGQIAIAEGELFVVRKGISAAEAGRKEALRARFFPPKIPNPILAASFYATKLALQAREKVLVAQIAALKRSVTILTRALEEFTAQRAAVLRKHQELLALKSEALAFLTRQAFSMVPFNNWVSSIEDACEAYVLASRQQIIEVMKPDGKPLEPMAEWLECWGPVFFAVPEGLVQGRCELKELFEKLPDELQQATEIAKFLLNPVGFVAKKIIEAELKKQFEQRVLVPAKELADSVLGVDALEFFDLLQEDVTRELVNAEFAGDSSDKGLRNFLRITDLIHSDMKLKPGGPAQFSPDFVPAYNAVVLSKLCLVAPVELNSLVANYDLRGPFVYGDELFSPSNGQGGWTILYRAVRSIDGGHQWMGESPAGEAYGYPFDPGTNQHGFRLWEDPQVREAVFDRLFRMPVAEAIHTTHPEIEVFPPVLHFGEILAGGSSRLEVTVKNNGTAPLALHNVGLGTDTGLEFDVESDSENAVLDPGEEMVLGITFEPEDQHRVHGNLLIQSNDADEPYVAVSLTGHTELSFLSSGDAHIDPAEPNRNFGLAERLQLPGEASTTESYVRFDVTDVSAPIRSAVLRLYAAQGSPDGGTLYMASSNWAEDTITFETAPGVRPTPIASVGEIDDNTWVELDVTDLVTGAGAYSFGLVGQAGYSSREGEQAPELVISIDGSAPILPAAQFVLDPVSGTAPVMVSPADTSWGQPTSWQWDFGDGNSSTEQNPTHLYTTPGTYTVTLTASNAMGSDTVEMAAIAVVTEPPRPLPRPEPSPTPMPEPAPSPPAIDPGVYFAFSRRPVSSDIPFDGSSHDGTMDAFGDFETWEVRGEVREGAQISTDVYINIVSQLKSSPVVGWSFGLLVDGDADIIAATTDETKVATVAEDRSQGFVMTQLIDPARNDGRRGVVSAVALFGGSQVTLPVVGTESVLKLEVRSAPTRKGEESVAYLSFEDGLRGLGVPLENILTVEGKSVRAVNQEQAGLALRFETTAPPLFGNDDGNFERGDDSPRFLRGDCNEDGILDISDAVCILDWRFLGASAPGCVAATNVNGDGQVDLSDPVSLLNFLFSNAEPPAAPFPACGLATAPMDKTLGCTNPPATCQ